jgi:hypothetical protein
VPSIDRLDALEKVAMGNDGLKRKLNLLLKAAHVVDQAPERLNYVAHQSTATARAQIAGRPTQRPGNRLNRNEINRRWVQAEFGHLALMHLFDR